MSANHVSGDVRPGSAAAAVFLVLLAAVASAHGQSGPLIEPVTDAELAATPDGDWLSFRGNLSAWAYSALDAVNVETVGQLDFAWAAADGGRPPTRATPLVRGGIVYLPQPGDVIHALDARTGDLIWEYRREHDYLDPEGQRPGTALRPGPGPDHAQHRDLAGRPVRRHDGRLHRSPGREHRRAGLANAGRRQQHRPPRPARSSPTAR